ncbi:Heparinase II/III-like protein [Opitutaceae bacterium TAV1]|nr:Heparinase II/III-like protein [Opitutaceae bacterium TAV1]
MNRIPSIFLHLVALALAAQALPAATASSQETGTGLLMTSRMQRELFSALDLSLPALKSVSDAAARGDFSVAQLNFASYLRQRTLLTSDVDPRQPNRNRRFNREVADAAAEGRVVGGLVKLWHTFPDNRIDWLHDETRAPERVARGVASNPEWQWQLCRMAFWADLGQAYESTGDERYARAWVAQLRSFALQCPPPETRPHRPGTAWRTIECGIRTRWSWPAAWHSFLLSPAVTDDDLVFFAWLYLQHGRFLQKFPSANGNWLTMEMSGLHMCGVLFPEFREARAWRLFAINKIHENFNSQFLADGAQYELSPGYHEVATGNILAIPDLARRVGRTDEIPAGYIAMIERALDFDLNLMTPDRSLPPFNDSWPLDIRRQLRGALDFFPKRDDFRWAATDGREGRPPAGTSHAFPDAGYYVMRSGWERDANYLVLDAGPLGAGHVHQDKLNLVLWAWGRELLFDSGGGSYERSKWRDYGVDTYSHNTVLVDGQPQRRPTRGPSTTAADTRAAARWQTSAERDFAAGTYTEGYGSETSRPATHTRRVFFRKPDLFVVADTLTPGDSQPHTYQARWHLLPTKTTKDAHTLAVTTQDKGQPNLAVIPLHPEGLEVAAVSGQTEPELLGWNIRKDTIPQNVPATTVTHTRRGSGVQTFLTLLVPIKPGAANPLTSVQPAGASSGPIRITLADGRRLLLTVEPDPAGAITVNDATGL